MNIETRPNFSRNNEENTKGSPLVVYDYETSSSPYIVTVDVEKAGNLLRFLRLPESMVCSTTIKVINSKFAPFGDCDYTTKTIRLNLAMSWRIFKETTRNDLLPWKQDHTKISQALAKVNLYLNALYLHEAYHLFDLYTNYPNGLWPEQDTQEAKRAFKRAAVIGASAAIIVGSAELMGYKTNVAWLDVPAIPVSGVAGFLVSGFLSYAQKYSNDPLEIMARGFALKHQNNPEWNNIVNFSLK